ncbi:MAG: ATP-binding protein [Phycisphaerales bacterium JB058]
MRVILTGQVGMDKKPFLEEVSAFAGQQGEPIDVHHIGDLMYKEAPDVKPGRILDLPLSRLNSLRRAAFKDAIMESKDKDNVIVNTHATFRWRHGLFSAFDFDQIQAFKPDLFVCLVDNIEVVHQRLHKDHVVDANLKDLMVWREEEILATELMSQAVPGSDFVILSRGRYESTYKTMFRLTTRPQMKKVYPSFPMSHVVGMPDIQAEIDKFREILAEHFITFDPGDVDEKLLLDNAVDAAKNGQDFFEHKPYALGGEAGTKAGAGAQALTMRTREVLDIAGDIDGQIYMRDFKLIDQADMIVSLVPELPGGIPGLSSGVERELQHAFEHAKDVYVVWKPAKNPSPFITETANGVFKSVDEAIEHFEKSGMFGQTNLFGH